MASIGVAPHVGLKSAYETEGWCEPPYRFSDAAVALLRERTLAISRERRPEVVHEKDSETVRAIHGCHDFDEVCAALVRHPYIVELAEQLVGGPVYVYQFKINLKQPHEGAAWPWHQDFAFWHEEDGMPHPDAVNIAISLDNVHESNGPLMAIPGSHRLGLLDLPDRRADGEESDWRNHVSADLAYTVNADRARTLAEQSGRKLFLGPQGSIQVFHPSIVHSSSNNVSSDRRALLLITYNAVTNAPTRPTRPAFLVSRDATPVEPRADERLELQALPDPAAAL
ncbi:phytanoyl-CoA dioxygenase family protein [Streptomyces sp. NPDC002676]